MDASVLQPRSRRAGAALPGEQRQQVRACMVHYSDYHVDSRIQRQARALAERGDEIDCVCLSPDRELRVGEGTIRLHQIQSRKLRGGFSYLRGYLRFFLGALLKVSALDRGRRFDVVEVHNMPDFLTATALVPKLRGIPVALNVHDTFPELFASLFGLSARHPLVRVARLEERASAALADALLFVTDEAQELLRRRGVTARHQQVVMNTPDEGVFGPRRAPVHPPADGPLRVVYHGGLGQRFGVESLVLAFGLMARSDSDISLDIYGPDPAEAHTLALQARRLAPLNVRVASRPTPVPEIPTRLMGAHVGVVPTLRDEFTELLLPVKLLECIHMGLPVVASRLPGIEAYFSERELLFFEPGSPEAIVRALREVRRNPDAAAERARRAAQRLAEIEWSRQRHAYLSLIDDLVAARDGVRKARQVSAKSCAARR